ncbi:MAG TPA: response regulator, partial [Verrucomicrobiota bacterium]|nr:response regulator [Verrucomicrobiota bacterium]
APRLPTNSAVSPGPATSATPPRAETSPAGRPSDAETFRVNFLEKLVAENATLRALAEEFGRDAALAARTGSLSDLAGRVHRLGGSAGLAGLPCLARLSSALEALLLELLEKPQLINVSTTRTVTAAVGLLGRLIRHAAEHRAIPTRLGMVLTVDDDPTANEVVLAALRRADITGEAVTQPAAALHLMAQQPFDLALLDVELPQLNGFELCRKLRELPGRANLPVVYITSYVDFESRAKAAGTTDSDWIVKPILPIELAVKALTHLIQMRCPDDSTPSEA